VRSRCSVSQVCVLPRASLLDQCERAAELPNPIFYEAKYQNRPYHDFDETGEPVKSYNPRYPLPPREIYTPP
jgi:hypothetical protein